MRFEIENSFMGEIYHLFSLIHLKTFQKFWSLGLTTISREMAYYNEEKFPKISWVLSFRPIDARKYGLSRFHDRLYD